MEHSNQIDVMKFVKENDEKLQRHYEKMKELERRERELNFGQLYKNYGNKPSYQPYNYKNSNTFPVDDQISSNGSDQIRTAPARNMYTYEIDMSNQNPFNPLPKNQIDYQQTNNVGGYMASRNNYQGEIEQMNNNVNSNQCKGYNNYYIGSKRDYINEGYSENNNYDNIGEYENHNVLENEDVMNNQENRKYVNEEYNFSNDNMKYNTNQINSSKMNNNNEYNVNNIGIHNQELNNNNIIQNDNQIDNIQYPMNNKTPAIVSNNNVSNKVTNNEEENKLAHSQNSNASEDNYKYSNIYKDNNNSPSNNNNQIFSNYGQANVVNNHNSAHMNPQLNPISNSPELANNYNSDEDKSEPQTKTNFAQNHSDINLQASDDEVDFSHNQKDNYIHHNEEENYISHSPMNNETSNLEINRPQQIDNYDDTRIDTKKSKKKSTPRFNSVTESGANSQHNAMQKNKDFLMKKNPGNYSKKYNGKVDAVSLRRKYETFWKKKPYMTKTNIEKSKHYNYMDDPIVTRESKLKMQKMQFVSDPIKHYYK